MLRTGEVKVWDAATGKEICQIQRKRGRTLSIDWSPDGTRLAAADRNHTIKVWSTASGKETLAFHGHSVFTTTAAWSPDGTRIASAGPGEVKIFRAASGEPLHTFTGFHGDVLSITWSPNSTKLATAHWDRVLRIWDVASKNDVSTQRLHGHTNQIMDVRWSPDGTRLASASLDRSVKVWEAASSDHTRVFSLSVNPLIESMDPSPDDTRLACATQTGEVRVLDFWRDEVVTLRGHQALDDGRNVMDVRWSADANILASAGHDETVRLWDATQIGVGRSNLRVLRGHTRRVTLTLLGHDGPITTVRWSPDGTKLYSAGRDGTVRVWDATLGYKKYAAVNKSS